MRIGFLGFGKSNRSLLKYLLKHQEAKFFVSEAKTLDGETKKFLEEHSVEYEEGGHTEKLLECDVVYVSPGIKPDTSMIELLSSRGAKLSTELQFFLDNVDPKKVVGITGTDGKSTATALMHHVLSRRGFKTFLGGNFGTPAVEALEGEYDYYVLEMSSFQLFWSERPYLSNFLVLNISEDHLDWHSSFEEYVDSKLKPAFLQTEGDLFVYNKHIERLRNLEGVRSRKIPFWTGENFATERELIVHGKKYTLPGNYPYQTRENILAVSILYMEMFNELESFLELLRDFKPLPHRMEYLGQIDGRHFYNDSKATSTHAVLGALSNFDKVVLIMCGIGKKENYSLFVEKASPKLKHLIMFGEISKELAPFVGKIPHSIVENMEEAFEKAMEVSEKGDVILLSPGGASFDMYENYAKRGEHFRELFERHGGDKV